MQKSLAAIGSFKKSGIYSSSGYTVPDDAVWKGLQKWASEEKIQELRDELKEVYQFDFVKHVDDKNFWESYKVRIQLQIYLHDM